jgi:alkylhydroperoxidase family enzyme
VTAPAEPPPGAGLSGSAPFTPAEQAALHFAEQMTLGTGRVPETAFARLRRHFSPGEIVEIAAVAGLFAYFNRFNNALEVEITR